MKYQPNPKKSVFLLFSLHCLANVDQSIEKRKLKVIFFNNRNKTDFDCFDQISPLCSANSTS